MMLLLSSPSGRAVADEPLRTGPDDRLHNSGWGRPPEAYRAPAIGICFGLDYMELLRTWANAAPADARELKKVQVDDDRVPARLLGRYALRLTQALGGTPSGAGEADPLAALQALCDRVRELGLTHGVVVTARRASFADDLGLGGWRTRPQRDEVVALGLATVVSCAPPLVLWGREPSLAGVKPGALLELSWLRRGEAAAPAAAAWERLRRIQLGDA